MIKETGIVYLVGAGPGDPGLFTIKGRQLLAEAEVVIYDRLVSAEILAWAHPAAEMIYVGKASGHHSWSQEQINQVLLDKAAEGKVVVRLKGGDPFVFGRGGEEAEFLLAGGYHYEIVPGITSAIAVPAYAGIPVTHRDASSSLAIITGHERPDRAKSNIHWDRIATGIDTLIFLMGLENLPSIVENLIEHGRANTTPVAVVQDGTLPGQRVVEGELNNIAERVKTADLQSPCVIIVGPTVTLRPHLKWLETKPLWNKRILVTRARAQASELSEQIRALGGQALEYPSIMIQPEADQSSLYHAFTHISDYDWLCFTSVNGVEIFFTELDRQERDVRDLAGIALAAIGPATAAALQRRGLRVEMVPDEFKAEEFAAALLTRVRAGERLLLPRAAGARAVLPEQLRVAGVLVDEIIVYQAVKDAGAATTLSAILAEQKLDYITFTSSSTVNNFVESCEGREWLAGGVKIACIGPITAETARRHGLRVDLIAERYTIDSLVEAIVRNVRGASMNVDRCLE